MRNSKLIFLAMIVSTLSLQGCAHTEMETKIDREVAQEATIKTHADLRTETEQLIESAPGLTAEQRSKLTALRKSTRAQVDELWSQSLKLRSVLVKDLVAANYDEDEVELIKQRIRDLEDKRLSMTFNAVEQANQILGHETTASRQRIMEEFFERGRGLN